MRMSLAAAHLLATGQVPEPPSSVVTGGEPAPAVGHKSNTADGVGVSGQELECPAGLQVPEAEGAVAAPGQKAAAIQRKHGTADEMRVPLEAVYLLAVGHVPQPQRVIRPRHQAAGVTQTAATAGKDPLPIG